MTTQKIIVWIAQCLSAQILIETDTYLSQCSKKICTKIIPMSCNINYAAKLFLKWTMMKLMKTWIYTCVKMTKTYSIKLVRYTHLKVTLSLWKDSIVTNLTMILLNSNLPRINKHWSTSWSFHRNLITVMKIRNLNCPFIENQRLFKNRNLKMKITYKLRKESRSLKIFKKRKLL